MDITERIVRIPMDIALIRRMDELILSRTAGFDTRAEFIREAVDALVTELTYDPAPDLVSAQPLADAPVSMLRRPVATAPEQHANSTELRLAAKPAILDGGAKPANEMLWGLHNRDYPSFWAASVIAELTTNEPGPAERSLDVVAKRAWEFGRQIGSNASGNGMKRAALFPTNEAKPQSAESAFRNYAVGSWADRGGELNTWGPLFTWQVCQIDRDSKGELLIGLTEQGYDLLTALEGVAP